MSKEVCPTCGQVIRKKHFVPPTLEEINAYIKENSLNVNGGMFFKYFTTGEPNWVDSEGKPVRNWKQKLLTWSSKNARETQTPNGVPPPADPQLVEKVKELKESLK